MYAENNLAIAAEPAAKPNKASKPKSNRRGRPKKPLFERHAAKVDVRGPDECWPWRGAKDGRGYGAIQGEGETLVRAHRVAWERENGPIPEGKIIMHSCDCPGCQNPAHLSPGTHKENAEDRMRKGRNNTASGAKMVRHRKLADSQVFEIIALRNEKKLPLKTIGVMYGVSDVNIGMICRGKTYGWLTGIGRDQQRLAA